jgi:hypothetical protein
MRKNTNPPALPHVSPHLPLPRIIEVLIVDRRPPLQSLLPLLLKLELAQPFL